MPPPGESRLQLERALSAAYAAGLLSENTLARRLDELFSGRLIDPAHLIGDLSYRRPGRPPLLAHLQTFVSRVRAWLGGDREPLLLALDWDGARDELSVGRHHSCDVRFDNPRVSRRHARLVFRDGVWIAQDLGSTNGTFLNGAPIGRSVIRPGDKLAFAGERVLID